MSIGSFVSGLLGGTHQTAPTTTTRSAPAYLMPYLKGIAGSAQDYYNNNQTPIGFNPTQTGALSSLSNIGYSPGLGNAGQSQLESTINGNYLYGNPGFNAALTAAENQIIPDVQGSFEAAGRYGSGLARSDMARQIGDQFAGLYNSERARQVSAAGNAPSYTQGLMQNEAYAPGLALNAGNLMQQQAQYEQQFPYNQLKNYAGLIYPQAGFGGTTAQTNYNNPAAGGLGGVLMGAQLGSAIPGLGTGMGAAIGGGLGLLSAL